MKREHFTECVTSDHNLSASRVQRGLGMKEVRDLKDLTIHDTQPSDEASQFVGVGYTRFHQKRETGSCEIGTCHLACVARWENVRL